MRPRTSQLAERLPVDGFWQRAAYWLGDAYAQSEPALRKAYALEAPERELADPIYAAWPWYTPELGKKILQQAKDAIASGVYQRPISQNEAVAAEDLAHNTLVWLAEHPHKTANDNEAMILAMSRTLMFGWEEKDKPRVPGVITPGGIDALPTAQVHGLDFDEASGGERGGDPLWQSMVHDPTGDEAVQNVMAERERAKRAVARIRKRLEAWSFALAS